MCFEPPPRAVSQAVLEIVGDELHKLLARQVAGVGHDGLNSPFAWAAASTPMPFMPVTPKRVDAHVCSTMRKKDDFHHACRVLVVEVTNAYAALRSTRIEFSPTYAGMAGSGVVSTC